MNIFSWFKNKFITKPKQEEAQSPSYSSKVDIKVYLENNHIGFCRSFSVNFRDNKLVKGYLDGMLFRRDILKNLFVDGKVNSKFQVKPLQIVISEGDKKSTIIDNLWLSNITGMVFAGKDYVIISSYGPASPWPEDGKTYWTAESIKVTDI